MQMDEAKIQRLLSALEEANIMIQRMQLMCSQIEKDLKVKLSEAWEVVK